MRQWMIWVLALCLCLTAGCAKMPEEETQSEPIEQETFETMQEGQQPEQPEQPDKPEQEEQPQEQQSAELPEEPAEEQETAEMPEEVVEAPEEPTGNGYVIAIDAGHQSAANMELEPVGPGASELKAKATGGTSGRTSGLAEYELNLQVSLKLEQELIARGYTVVMTRRENDVDLSNYDRAAVANEAGAAAYIRIHANGSEDTSVNGAMTICMTPDNPYNGDLYEQSYALSELVLDHVTEKTGANRQYIWETDTMAGNNWSEVPVTILEMGYMTNPDEDTKLATEEYQWLVVEGVADAVDVFLGMDAA